MLKRALLILSLIFVSSLVFAQEPVQDKNLPTKPIDPNNSNNSNNPKTNESKPLDKFVKLDDIGILRVLYPKETLAYKSANENSTEPSLEQNYQVGDSENHKVSVLSRTIGKFTQTESQELLAIISIDNPSNTPYKSGLYALLLQISKDGTPELITRSNNLYRPLAPNKGWKPLLTTDINFDKQEDLVMLEEEKKALYTYSIYTWDQAAKDFSLAKNHPAQTLLSYYSLLNTAANLGVEGEQAAGDSQLKSAYEKLSPKMQSQQDSDVLRRRLKNVKKVDLGSLKILIKSETSALIRIQYRLVDDDGFSQTYEGDYQIRRYNDDWLLDSERLKSISLAK